MSLRSLSSSSASLVPAMDQASAWVGYKDAIDAASRIGCRLKVAVAIVDHGVHIAIGFPTDSTINIANTVFDSSIGQDWREKATEIGGGDLRLDFATNGVKIESYSPSMDHRAVPRSAEAAVIQAVRGMMNR